MRRPPIRKRQNIYDLVEQTAAQRGIPRLQLWQEVAKALTDAKLKIQSSPFNSTGALAQWLVGFRNAVDRCNEPHGGITRILKHIIVREVDFETWLRKAGNLRRGPKRGTTGFRAPDRELFAQMSRLIKKGQARSPYGAALMLANQGRVSGPGTRESKAKRLSAAYRLEERGAR